MMLADYSPADPTFGSAPQEVFVVEARGLRDYVEEYFNDIPVMAKIAGCESKFRHFSKRGQVIRGEIVPEDVGVMQINETYHRNAAQKLGYDIYSVNGNLKYARYLFQKEGTTPWLSSVKCWGKENHIART